MFLAFSAMVFISAIFRSESLKVRTEFFQTHFCLITRSLC
jgi:hypothetical protein